MPTTHAGPDILRVRSAVADFVTRAGFDWAAMKSAGAAVPLASLVDGHPLCLVEQRRLTHGAVLRRLSRWGLPAPMGAGSLGRALAGFVFGHAGQAIIFINRDDPFSRRRFSLAHEIGHFMLHGGGALARATARPALVEDEPDDPRELEAHAFAAELLMPWEMVMPDAMPLSRGEIGLERAITRLMARLQVSRQAAARRLREWPGAA